MVKLKFILASLTFFVFLSSGISVSKEQSELQIAPVSSENSAYEIIVMIKEELKEDPDNLRTITHWAFIADYCGLWAESIKANTQLIELGDVDPATYNNLGRAYMNLDKFAEAEKYLKKSLEIQPDNFFAFHNLGLLLKHKGDFEGSIQYFKKALEISPNWPQTNYDLGNTYLGIKDYEEAIQYYKKAMELGLRDVNIFKNLGVAYLGKDDKRQALNYFKKALNLSPEDQALKEFFQMTKDAIEEKGKFEITPE